MGTPAAVQVVRHPSFLPVEQLLFGRAAGEKEICCRCGTCTDAEGNEYTIAAEKLPGDPGVEICMSQAEFLARGGASAPSPAGLQPPFRGKRP